MRWLYVLGATCTLVCALAAAYVSYSKPINSDEAYNLQIAESISTSFCYCTRYRPERVFPVEESVNGPVQYVGAAFFKVRGNPDDARAGAVAVGVLLLGLSLLLLEPLLVFAALALYFVWPWYHVIVPTFGGEVYAIALALFGLQAIRRKSVYVAVCCFGLAAESKLISLIVTLPSAWAIIFGRTEDTSLLRRALRATRESLIIAAGTIAALFVLIAFSVIHSTRSFDPSVLWHTFSGYVLNMIGQGEGGQNGMDLSRMVRDVVTFESPMLLALFVVSAVVLLRANPAYCLFVAATLIWWLYYGKTERHLVISFFATLMLAGAEARGLLDRVAGGRRTPGSVLYAIAFAAVASFTVAVGIATHSSFDVTPRRRFADPQHVVSVAAGHMIYSKQLVAALRRHRYVLTSGWWQMPEISLREHLEFYDRTSPANANLPRTDTVLFFDRANHLYPFTSVRGNCDRVLYSEGPLVICTPKRNRPLSYQPRP